MNVASEKPLDWIKQVDQLLLELEEKPQFGFPTAFNWGHLEQYLQEIFKRPSLKLDSVFKGWTKPEELYTGLGSDLLFLTINWLPLPSPAYFVASSQDIKWLMAELLGGEKQASYFYDFSLVQGFFHYFAAEMLLALEKMEFAPPLSPRIGEQSEEDLEEKVEKSPCFVIDVSLTLEGKTIWGRILLSESFREDWKSYFVNLPPSPLSEEMREKILVDACLEVGRTVLNFQEWQETKQGDFILLDHCSFDPVTRKGGVILTVNQSPIFRGRFKENGIKLTEYPIYEEVNAAMNEEPFESRDLENELSSELEDEDLYGDELDEDEEKQEIAPPSGHPSLSPEELPVQLTVEVGRIRMTAKELMNLAPGNLLEVNVSPEQGVDLLINGKKVGRGELIRLGETLGVRIISL